MCKLASVDLIVRALVRTTLAGGVAQGHAAISGVPEVYSYVLSNWKRRTFYCVGSSSESFFKKEQHQQHMPWRCAPADILIPVSLVSRYL
jgi:hypothetical protein